MKCPYCNQEHPDDAKFCDKTGKMLIPAEQVGQQGEREISGEPLEEHPVFLQRESQSQIGSASPENLVEEQPPEHALQSSELEAKRAETPAPFAEMDATDEKSIEPPSPPIMKKRYTIQWVLGGCIGIPLVILLLLVALALIDPFKLHLWGRLNGRYDAAAEVMPANTGLYLGINIGNMLLTHADRVITPFTTAEQAGEAFLASGYLSAPPNPARGLQADIFGDLFQQLEEETGMKIPEDFNPWVGQYAGIGMLGFDAYSVSSVPQGEILAIEVRNLRRADAFLKTLLENMKEIQNIDYNQQTYKDIVIYNQRLGNSPSFSYCRSGRMLLIASDVDILKSAIDRQNGQALTAQKEYTKLIGSRSRDWSASLYLSPDVLEGATAPEALGISSLALPLISLYPELNWSGLLVNASAVKQGARVDLYMGFDASTQASSMAQDLQAAYSPASQVLQMLPQDTVMYLASPRFDLLTQSLLDTALNDETEQADFYDEINQVLGFSIQDDLIEYLNGEWALYVVPSSHGLLPEQMEMNLAINLLAQTDPGFDIQRITDGLGNLGPFNGFTLNSQQREGITYYEISVLEETEPVFAFGATNDYFTLGTDLDSLQLSTSSETSLLGASSYQKAVDSLTLGVPPTIYLDLENLFANIREGMPVNQRESFNESVSGIEPISIIAAASQMLGDDVVHTSIAIVLEDR